MKPLLFAVAWLVLGTLSVLGAEPSPDELDQAMRKQLEQVLPEVKFTGRLEGAMDYLHNLTHANMSVEWAILEADGVTKDAPIQVDFHNVRLSQAIQLILDQPVGSLGYEVNGGVLVVSTKEKLSRIVRTDFYDIREFIEIPDFEPPPSAQSSQNGQGAVDVFSGSSGVNWTDAKTRQERIDDVIKLIEDIVMSDSWKDNGGQIGSIRELNGNLIVTTTPANQEQIKALLAQWAANDARTLRVRATWVVARESELSTIAKKVDAPPTTQKSSASPLMEVDPRDLEKLPGPHCEAQTLTMSARPARVSATYEQPLGNASKSTDPDHATLSNARVWLDVQAALSTDRQYVSLILRPQIEAYQGPSKPADNTADNANHLKFQNLLTSVRIPAGKTILIGSTTLTSSTRPSDSPKLFLFVQVAAE